MTMLRQPETELEYEEDAVALCIETLRRKVAWQVATAYGLPVEEVHVPEPPRIRPAEPVPVAPLSVPEPEPEPAPEPPPAAVRRLPTLLELERLVAAATPKHPDLAHEWRWYLFYLRGFAHADGSLDDDFGLLVETAFAPLFAA